MGLLDPWTPVYYKVLRMGVQKVEAGVVAVYDVQIIALNGNVLGTQTLESTMSPTRKQPSQPYTTVTG